MISDDEEKKLKKAKIRSSPWHEACGSECWGRNVQRSNECILYIIVWYVNVADKGKDCAEQIYGLKGQCHEIFDFRLFSRISYPEAREYTIRVVSHFF